MKNDTKKINIILAHNYEGSITKIAWMYAHHLTKKGFNVCVYYPSIIDQYDYEVFDRLASISKVSFLHIKLFLKGVLKKLLPWSVYSSFFRRPRTWVGHTAFGSADVGIATGYDVAPHPVLIRRAEITFCLQSQLLPWILMSGSRAGTVVDSLHTSDYTKVPLLRDWRDYCYKDLASKVDCLRFAVSNASRDFFRSLNIKVDDVIPNGIDIENFSKVDFEEREDAVLMYCDPRPEKGFQCGIQILDKLKEKYPHLKFASIGNMEGLSRDRFDIVHGFVTGKKMGSVFSKYRYFLLPSLFEGFPAPPLEGMATGIVCVLPKVSGISEYAVEGRNSVLFSPGDVEGAVTAFSRVYNDQGLARAISEAGPSTAAIYSWEKTVDKFIQFVASAVGVRSDK